MTLARTDWTFYLMTVYCGLHSSSFSSLTCSYCLQTVFLPYCTRVQDCPDITVIFLKVQTTRTGRGWLLEWWGNMGRQEVRLGSDNLALQTFPSMGEMDWLGLFSDWFSIWHWQTVISKWWRVRRQKNREPSHGNLLTAWKSLLMTVTGIPLFGL